MYEETFGSVITLSRPARWGAQEGCALGRTEGELVGEAVHVFPCDVQSHTGKQAESK